MSPDCRCQEVCERVDDVARASEHQQHTEQPGNERRSRDQISDRADLSAEKDHCDIEPLRRRVGTKEGKCLPTSHTCETAEGLEKMNACVQPPSQNTAEKHDQPVT